MRWQERVGGILLLEYLGLAAPSFPRVSRLLLHPLFVFLHSNILVAALLLREK